MNYKGFSDIELWRKHQNGDINAYNELFDRYAPYLYRQASRWIKNSHDVEELVMDLLLNLWIKRADLNPEAGLNLKSYLSKSIRNRIINHLQKNLPQIESLEDTGQYIALDSRSADYETISREMEGIYEAFLKSLSPQRLKVFKLSREEGLTYSQIAEKLNLSTNTVENYMVSALAILRKKGKSWFTVISTFYLLMSF